MRRLTDKTAVRIALHLAIDYERSLIDAYSGNKTEQAVIDAQRRIDAFKRVLDRYYGGERPDPAKLAAAKYISIFELMKS